jgi:hypothetical protein
VDRGFCLAALARIIYIAQRESGAATAAERGFIALMPLSAYAFCSR